MNTRTWAASFLIPALFLFTSCKEDNSSSNTYNGVMSLRQELAVKTFDGKMANLKSGERDADLTISRDGKIVLFFGDDESQIEMKFPMSAIPNNEGVINAPAADLGQTFSVTGSKEDTESQDEFDFKSYEVTKVVGSQTQYVKEDPNCISFCKKVYRNVDQVKNVTCHEHKVGTKVTTTLKLEFRNEMSGEKIGDYEGSIDWSKDARTVKSCK